MGEGSFLQWLDSESTVARLKYLELLERKSKYRDLSEGVEHRFASALDFFPEEHKEGALAVFSSTLYVSQPLVVDAWKSVWWMLQRNEGLTAETFERDVLLLELDRDKLKDSFFEHNNIQGRLENNSQFQSSNDLIDSLKFLEKGGLDKDVKNDLISALEKPVWINLVDISLSGTSVCSDLKRLKEIASFIPSKTEPKIITVLLMATEKAEQKLQEIDAIYHRAVGIPNSASLAHEKYTLISDKKLIDKMKSACDWFSKHVVLKTESRFSRQATADPYKNVGQFGFKEGGWSIVTYKNAPNNSLPILWFSNEQYTAPFERVDSRTNNHSTSTRKEWLEGLTVERVNAIRSQLKGTEDE